MTGSWNAGAGSNGAWYTKLHWQVIIALLAGALFGRLAPSAAFGIGFLGDLFLRLLKMIIIPLIFTSLVSGIASLGDARRVGRVGIRTLVYYTLTTTLAITVGLTLVNLIRPGDGLDLGVSAELPEGLVTTPQTLPEFLLRMVPDNVMSAMAQGEVLPVIVFAILFGLFITRLNSPNVEAVQRLVDGVLEVVQALTLAIVRLAPIGIFALLAREVARSGLDIIIALGPYFVVVGAGLAVHALVTLPVLLMVLGRRHPLEYARKVLPALATAFSTASSSATLPLSMECAEREAGIPRGVSSFVLPLGATVNMDGTALYEAVAALTIAQMYGVSLDLSQQALVLVTALLASVGAAGIPMAGLVMLVVVLQAVGLPLEGIATIIAVDRVLDMMRTATNVWSDLVGTAVISRFEGSAT
ncbi:MAG: dicarboxylate/amino acid:cation symporter [Deltaproteobacteria bacterium]|jgi:Na+/H+-dicarboxylate symporter|nr:dicarboxylate/amino acid:cation symporter [Deltaproteobacteria bacterium]MBW2530063.1 dicarboxylate/amino acid:cation symporter [Deltaproteobacteria bacterium]